MIFAFAVLVAALTVTPAVPQAEVRNVRISSPKVAVSRAHADSEAYVSGLIRVDMSFAKGTAKTPVLRLVCLCETDGALSVREICLNKLRTYEPLRDAEKTAAFKAAGIQVPGKDRDAWYGDPARFTPCLPEVTKASFAGAVYGTGEVGRGFFRLGRSATMPRVLLYRIEVWQNGALVAKSESSRAGLGKYEIPQDWYVWKKYPAKFRYLDVR